MKVTQVQPQVAAALRPVFSLPDAGFATPPVAAFLSPEASPDTRDSDVAALALPLFPQQLDQDPVTTEAIRSALLASMPTTLPTTRQLKGAAVLAEVFKQVDPAFSPVANSVAVVAATKEFMDALADEDASTIERFVKSGKLVVAAGNLASDFGDAIPGMTQAAPYLKTFGLIVKVGDAITLLRPEDGHPGDSGLAAIQAAASRRPGLPFNSP